MCAYFRAISDGSGYCEKFSFQCEPQSVCDDFVAAGNVKTSSASTADRLRKLLPRGIAAHGLSLDSREQNRFRKSKSK